jgi:hypothetical protein
MLARGSWLVHRYVFIVRVLLLQFGDQLARRQSFAQADLGILDNLRQDGRQALAEAVGNLPSFFDSLEHQPRIRRKTGGEIFRIGQVDGRLPLQAAGVFFVQGMLHCHNAHNDALFVCFKTW